MANVGDSIRYRAVKIKQWYGIYEKDVFLAALVLLVALASFGLGKMSAQHETEPITVVKAEESGVRPMYLGGGGCVAFWHQIPFSVVCRCTIHE